MRKLTTKIIIDGNEQEYTFGIHLFLFWFFQSLFFFLCKYKISIVIQISWQMILLKLLLRKSLRKVKMDQRKLMDNANTITDMAKVQHLF